MSSRAAAVAAILILVSLPAPAVRADVYLPSQKAAAASQIELDRLTLSTYPCTGGQSLDFDISPTQQQCRSLEVTTDKTEYRLGENIRITVRFTHLLPGCVEIQVLHTHQIRLAVHDSNDVQVEAWQWQTDHDMTETFTWKPSEADTYVITVSLGPKEKSEIEDQATIQVTSDGPALPRPAIQWLLYGAIACVLVAGYVAYLLFRPRSAKGDAGTLLQGMSNTMSRSCTAARLSIYRTAQ